MSIGSVARTALGPAFPVAGGLYRRVFVDVRKVAASLPLIDGLLLDVGGGDGAVLNPLLDRQPTLRVTAIDIATGIGASLRPDLRPRVVLRPGTSVREYMEQGGETPKAVFLSDVFHHVPFQERTTLVRDVLDVFKGNPPTIIVKEIVPQGVRSALAFWADRNVSGDKGVQPLSPADLVELMRSVAADLRVYPTSLLDVDYPNYCLIFRGGASGSTPAEAHPEG